MKDISHLIYFWIGCCGDLWRTKFLMRVDGAYDFPEIEDALFRILVMRVSHQNLSTLATPEFFRRLRVRYKSDFDENRQVCAMQKAGNILCKTEVVMLRKENDYTIKGIDTMGTMMDSKPYVEVVIGENFILEPPENLSFLLIN
jgi:hypothetical protein